MVDKVVEKSKKEKIVAISGFILALFTFAFSFIPYIGYFAFSPAFGVFVFAWFTYRIFKQQKKTHLLPRIAMLLCVLAAGIGLIQYPKIKPALETRSKYKEGKRNMFIYLFKEAFFSKDEQAASSNAVADNEDTNNEVINDEVDNDEVDNEKKIPGQLKSKERPFTEVIYSDDNKSETYFSLVDNLRIRSSPDLNGEILGAFDFGIPVEFLEDSVEKDTIRIAGRKALDYWKKIKYRPNNFVEPIVGWVFGGGLKQASEGEPYIYGDIHCKTIFEYTAQEIAALTKIEAEEGYTYNGLIMYRADEEMIRDGRFYLEGRSEKGKGDIDELQFIDKLEGTFAGNTLHGMFTKTHILYEGSYTYKIKYDYNKCEWNSIRHQAEDKIYETENPSPKACSFEFMRSTLPDIPNNEQ